MNGKGFAITLGIIFLVHGTAGFVFHQSIGTIPAIVVGFVAGGIGVFASDN